MTDLEEKIRKFREYGNPILREEFEERAAILEYEAGYKRDEAERLARSMVYGL